MNKNLKSFLNTIGFSEGADYNTLVGGGKFTSFADHPRVKVFLPKLNIHSTAAGKYQILARYFDAYKKTLNLKDFSPASQDAIATQMIKEQRAMDDIEAGDIAKAILKCSNIWASFPGAGYGQHEHKMADLLAFYEKDIAYVS